MRPVVGDADRRDQAGHNILAIGYWRRLYHESGASEPECWRRGLLKPDGHTVSVSDLFFIAHSMRMLSTQCGEVARLEAATVVTREATSLEADVMIKCVGFEINEGNEKLLGRAHIIQHGEPATHPTLHCLSTSDVYSVSRIL